MLPPAITRRRWRVALALVAVALLATGGALVWLRSLFCESGAQQVPSLAAYFGAKSVLCVFAHPDDEIIAAALLAAAARQPGTVVRIITATKGESGHPDPPLARPADLGLVRAAKTLRHSFALGVAEHEVWDLPDAGLSALPPGKMAGEIAVRLGRWQPDLVVTFDPATGEEIAARQPAAQFAIPAPAALKLRAWRIHESQASYLRTAWRLPPWLLYRVWREEFYALAPVPPGTG